MTDCLRIGVTGHRSLPEDQSLADRVAEAVRGVIDWRDEPPCLVVVSALAPGADRLVAEAVLRVPGAELEALLPMPPEEVELDFPEPASRAEFRDLLARAREIDVIPSAGSRRANFESAGLAMLERIDVLLALWDGEPARGQGGTAEIVAYAETRGLPVVWIATTAPYPVRILGGALDRAGTP
jgi:hypothetical protein